MSNELIVIDGTKNPTKYIHNWYVYVQSNILNDKTFDPFYVGISSDVYEFRRYSNRPIEWENALKDKRMLCSVLFDEIESEEKARILMNTVIWYYISCEGRINLLNTVVEPKRPPKYDKIENVVRFVFNNIPKDKVKYRYNGLTMSIDVTKRNYKRIYSK